MRIQNGGRDGTGAPAPGDGHASLAEGFEKIS
jgi:hypothetical protein